MIFVEIKSVLKPGDNLIFLGAGLSSKIANKFSEYLKK